MIRRIVFVGGPQTKALARAYRSEVADDTKDEVAFVGIDALMRDAAQRVVGSTNVLVLEVGAAGDSVQQSLLPPNADIIRVPAVSADFLWPVAGRAHPRNTGSFPMPDGPYPAGHGDSFLDRMMQEGVGEEAAIARYLALDIAAEGDLDGRLSRRLDQQAALDTSAGTDLADFIGNRFREAYLFATMDRPRLKLFKRIAAPLFRKLGSPDEAAQGLRTVPLLSGSQPIHPGVLAHFRMAMPPGGHRYPMLDEGRFTFEEYCRRYLRFEWNEALHRGIALARTDPQAAIPELREGLERSPESRAGKRALKLATEAMAASSAVAGIAAVAAEQPDPAAAGQTGRGLTMFAPKASPASEAPVLPDRGPAGGGVSPAAMREEAPPTGYVALPPAGEQPPTQVKLPPSNNAGDRSTPLPPLLDLIAVLPGLLQGNSGNSTQEREFAAMPETMPPPPLRPMLPPELQGEPMKAGLLAKLARFFRN